jgi:hypothetical protein
VVISATKNLLPRLYVSFVQNLAIFSLNLTLALPSLQRDEVEWVQFILQLLICVGACLFLWFSGVASDDDENKNKRKQIEAKIKSSRGYDTDAHSELEQFDVDEISEDKPPKKLMKLPWQDSMDRILLGEGLTTLAIILGVFVAGIVLAGSSLVLGTTDVAKVLVVTGSVLALVAFAALAIRQWFCFQKKAANIMFASLTVEEVPIYGLPEPAKAHDLKVGDEYDKDQPMKHFWARTTLDLANLSIFLLNVIFLPMVQSVVDAVIAGGGSSFLHYFQLAGLPICIVSVAVVFRCRQHHASMMFGLGSMDGEYKSLIAAKFGAASTTSTSVEYDNVAMVAKVRTNAPSMRMVDASFLKLMVPFKFSLRYMSLALMAEKVAMVLAATWCTDDPHAICMLSGLGLMFLLTTGAYTGIIPRWLSLSARASTFVVSLVAVVEVHAVDVRESIACDGIIFAVFCTVALYYLWAFDPRLVAHKLWNMAHLPMAVNRVAKYEVPKGKARPGWLSEDDGKERKSGNEEDGDEEERGVRGERVQPAQGRMAIVPHLYDVLVVSPAQCECVVVHCSAVGDTPDESDRVGTHRTSVVVVTKQAYAAASFRHWIAFGMKYRPYLENLTELVLVSRGIKGALGEGIGELKSLMLLDVSSNEGLTSLPQSIGNLQKLTKIRATECGITGAGIGALSTV